MTQFASLVALMVFHAIAGATQQANTGGIEGVVTVRGAAEPIPGVRVTLSTTALRTGATLSDAPVVWTDAYGRFAFTQVRAGSYHLTFSHNGHVRQELGRSLFAGQGMTIAVTSGQTVRVSMQMTPTAVVSGRVHDITGGVYDGIQVEILRQTFNSDGVKTLERVASAWTNDRGEYRLFYVTPGHYVVRAGPAPTVSNQLDPGSSPNAFDPPFRATYYPAAADIAEAVAMDLTAGAELNGIDIVVGKAAVNVPGQTVNATPATLPAISINGQLQTDQPGAVNSVPYSRFRVSLRAVEDTPSQRPRQVTATVTSDGSFVFEVRPGSYRLSLFMPEGFYVKEAHLGKADALNQPLHITTPDEPLSILIGSGVGEIDGVVRDQNMQIMTNASVVLVPDRGPTRPDLYKSVHSGVDGHFLITNVPPGDYAIFAWEDIEPYAWFDPDFMQRFKSKGRSVRVAAASKISGELIAFPAIN